ncbi:hypothetical protein Tco_1355447, partial [Tanacetum coccineum]
SEVVHSHLSSTEVRRRWDTRLQRPANSVNSSSERMGLIQDQLKTRPEFDGNPLNGWFREVASDDKGRYKGVRSLTRHDLTPQLHESAGGLPSLKLSLHSCSLPGSTNAMGIETSIALVLPAREHECNGSFNLGRPPALS